jgi:hypothetical protein
MACPPDVKLDTIDVGISKWKPTKKEEKTI